MKNAAEIICNLQNVPRFHRVLESKCIQKLKSSLLFTVQNSIKSAYIKNETLFFVISAGLHKRDLDNIISTIKSILNSKMIMESQNFVECLDVKISDVVCFKDYKPVQEIELYGGNSHAQAYQERATGSAAVEIKDEKLSAIALEIQNIIKSSRSDT